ncbi:magnesium transporter CorA family protein [Candidatus Microgenomates bacterium]|nr:magnesium transporter CorA family protein [Candidatus Microgenomates bacterium]
MNIQTVKLSKTSFIVCTNSQELELKFLKNNFGFSSLHLDDFVNKTQVPKIEEAKNYTLVVLDFPYIYQNSTTGGKSRTNGETNLFLELLNLPQASLSRVPLPKFSSESKGKRIVSSQVDFFIGPDFLVVLHDGMLTPINDCFLLCQKTLKKRTELMEKGSSYLFYYLIDHLVDNSFSVINDISLTIDRIDKQLETGHSEKILEEISTTRRNIVVYHTMTKPMIPLFRGLEEGKHRQLNDELTPLWGNILDHLQKIWDRLEDNRELIEGISESNESLLSSKTNRIITILTIFSAILLPLNLLASIYGMNVQGLPFANTPTAFITVMLLMSAVGIILLFLFKSRRWL